MPNPISNNASRSPLISAPQGDSTSGSVSASPDGSDAQPAPRVVDLDPVYVVGQPTQEELVRAYEQSQRNASCSAEKRMAVLSCSGAAASALGAVASAGTILGAVAGVAMTFVASVHCGKDLRAVYDCEQGR